MGQTERVVGQTEGRRDQRLQKRDRRWIFGIFRLDHDKLIPIRSVLLEEEPESVHECLPYHQRPDTGRGHLDRLRVGVHAEVGRGAGQALVLPEFHVVCVARLEWPEKKKKVYYFGATMLVQL